MVLLDVPVPPMLEAAVGYGGQARFFGIYWGAGDESYHDDGRRSGTGNPHAYLAFVRHPAVALELSGVNLGSSDDDAEYLLIIDRRDRRAFVTPTAEARRFLRGQWNESPVGPAVLTQDEFAAVFNQLGQDFKARPTPTAAEVVAAMKEQRRHESEMVAWLDATPHARRAGEVMRKMTECNGRPETHIPD